MLKGALALTSVNSKKCTKCNLEFSSKYRFCTKCGQELRMIDICPSCSSQLNKTSKFCSNCGDSTNPNKAVTNVKHVYVPYSASKDESTEEINISVAGNSTSSVTGFLIGGGIGFLAIIFLVYFIASSGGGNHPPCAQMPRGFYLTNKQAFVQTGGWDWGRTDGKMGYCVLPNSNEVIYSQIGSLE
jgi:hypothetical protein